MSKSYSKQILTERTEQRHEARLMLEVYLTTTAPSFEQCQKDFEKRGLLLTKKDYIDICEKVNKKRPDSF